LIEDALLMVERSFALFSTDLPLFAICPEAVFIAPSSLKKPLMPLLNVSLPCTP